MTNHTFLGQFDSGTGYQWLGVYFGTIYSVELVINESEYILEPAPATWYVISEWEYIWGPLTVWNVRCSTCLGSEAPAGSLSALWGRHRYRGGGRGHCSLHSTWWCWFCPHWEPLGPWSDWFRSHSPITEHKNIMLIYILTQNILFFLLFICKLYV